MTSLNGQEMDFLTRQGISSGQLNERRLAWFQGQPARFDSLTAATTWASTAATGTKVIVAGNAALGDGGGFVGEVQASANANYPGAGKIKPVGSTVSPEMWGGGPSAAAAANYTAFTNAIAFAQTEGVQVSVGGGTYSIDPGSDAGIAIDPANALTIVGQGRAQTTISSTKGVFVVEQEDADAVVDTTATADITFGDTQITVTTTTNMAVGQLVYIESTEDMEETSAGPYDKRYVSEVKSVDSGTAVTLVHSAPDTFTASGNTIAVKTFTVAPIEIGAMTLVGTKNLPAVLAPGIVTTQYAADLTIDCDYTEINSSDLLNPNFDGTDPLLDGIRCMRSLRVVSERAKQSYLVYGFLVQQGSADCELRFANTRLCRHSNNFGIGSHLSRVSHCTATSCYAGFDSHASAYDSSFVACRDYNGTVPTKLRGRRDVARGCVFDGGLEATVDPGVMSSFAITTAIGRKLEKLFYNCEINGNAQRVLITGTRFGMYGGSIENTAISATGGKHVSYLDLIDVIIDGTNIASVSGVGVTFVESAYVRTRIAGCTADGPDAGIAATDSRSSSKLFFYFTETGASLQFNENHIDGWRTGCWVNTSGTQKLVRMKNNDLLNNGFGIRIPTSATEIGSMAGNTHSGNFIDIDNYDDASQAIEAPVMPEETYTATNIADAAHEVNTEFKRLGMIVFDRSNGRPMIAQGNATTSNWTVADGSATVTPS